MARDCREILLKQLIRGRGKCAKLCAARLCPRVTIPQRSGPNTVTDSGPFSGVPAECVRPRVVATGYVYDRRDRGGNKNYVRGGGGGGGGVRIVQLARYGADETRVVGSYVYTYFIQGVRPHGGRSD